MPAPLPKTSAVIGRSLLISAASMFLIAFLIGSGTLAMESSQVISGALVAVGVVDVAIGVFFLRKGRPS
jgi:hypothetical protein